MRRHYGLPARAQTVIRALPPERWAQVIAFAAAFSFVTALILAGVV
jgi:hypothetical protein